MKALWEKLSNLVHNAAKSIWSSSPRVLDRRPLLSIASVLLLLLVILRHWGSPTIAEEYSPDAEAALGLMWQVHAGFLAIGFAGLTIASQVYADSPLAPGVAHRAILKHVRLTRLIATGLLGNLLIAIGAIWLATDAAVLFLFLVACLPTVALTLQGYRTLAQLYSDPAAVERLIGLALSTEVVEAAQLSDDRARRGAAAALELEQAGVLLDFPSSEHDRVDIHVGRPTTIRQIRRHVVKAAIQELNRAALQTVASSTAGSDPPTAVGMVVTPQVVLAARPARRLRQRTVLFSLISTEPTQLVGPSIERVKTLLLDSIEFESDTYVDPEERILHEVNAVQDAATEAIRAGAFKRAGRAFELLERAADAGWRSVEPGGPQSMTSARRDWLVLPIAEMEWGMGADAQAAGLLLDSAVSRSIRAIVEQDFDRFVAEVVSFQRLWSVSFTSSDSGGVTVRGRILVALQNLAEFAIRSDESFLPYRESCVWVFVNIAKEASDLSHHDDASRVVEYLTRLYRYGEPNGMSRIRVRSGQLALAGWLLLRKARGDIIDDGLLQGLLRGFSRDEAFQALDHLHEASNPLARWNWWESQESVSFDFQFVEISNLIDRAAAIALAQGSGLLTQTSSERASSDAARMLRAIDAIDPELRVAFDLDSAVAGVQKVLSEIVERWKRSEDARLSESPLSKAKLTAFEEAFDATMSEATRLIAEFDAPAGAVPPRNRKADTGPQRFGPETLLR